MNILKASFYDKLRFNITKFKSFTLTGLTTFSKLLLLYNIYEISNRKVLFITSTEQSALKYASDIKTLFDKDAETIPYQNVSLYETIM